MAGISRSVTLTIAYLMRHYGLPMQVYTLYSTLYSKCMAGQYGHLYTVEPL